MARTSKTQGNDDSRKPGHYWPRELRLAVARAAVANHLIGNQGANYTQIALGAAAQSLGTSLGNAASDAAFSPSSPQPTAPEAEAPTTQDLHPIDTTKLDDAVAQMNQDLAQLKADAAVLSEPLNVVAAPGSSISTILGTSDPGAIGRFMQLNGLTSSTIQAGQAYQVPVTSGNYTDDEVALGQNTLNTDDNARMAQQLTAGMAQINAQMAQVNAANQQINLAAAPLLSHAPGYAAAAPAMAIDNYNNSLHFGPGIFQNDFNTAVAGLEDSSNTWVQRGVNGLLALATAPEALAETIGQGIANIPYDASITGQHIAQATLDTTTDQKVVDVLSAISSGASAFSNSVGVVAPFEGVIEQGADWAGTKISQASDAIVQGAQWASGKLEQGANVIENIFSSSSDTIGNAGATLTAQAGRLGEAGALNLAAESSNPLINETSVLYGPASDAGPLPSSVSATFRSSTYAQTNLTQAVTLYRVYGGTADQIGPYWTATPPSGPLQAQLDLALNPEWGNTATQTVTIEVPAGNVIYSGTAATQGLLPGGGSQVFIPKVNPSWIKP